MCLAQGLPIPGPGPVGRSHSSTLRVAIVGGRRPAWPASSLRGALF